MKKSFVYLQLFLLTALLAAPPPRLYAQATPTPDPLFQTIQSLDTQLFDAYNHCDLEKFGSLLADDLEFYHDKTGLSRGRPALVEGIKNNICGKVTRELVPGTLEVYPIADYGAVEIGVHRFHHPGHESTEQVGEAKFITLWQKQKKDGSWKVTRVISFDHHALTK
jgi:ketosteroid isomerase-like protein